MSDPRPKDTMESGIMRELWREGKGSTGECADIFWGEEGYGLTREVPKAHSTFCDFLGPCLKDCFLIILLHVQSSLLNFKVLGSRWGNCYYKKYHWSGTPPPHTRSWMMTCKALLHIYCLFISTSNSALSANYRMFWREWQGWRNSVLEVGGKTKTMSKKTHTII